jgi:uncharacterized membrane protein YraQ (UPF0718 family)
VSLQKQGANKGATTAFLISTPESGIDSIAVTYALLDPVMTVARPAAAFATAAAAGLAENLTSHKKDVTRIIPDLSCPVDNCCDGIDCAADTHQRHHSFFEKLFAGMKFAAKDLWGDMAGWFFLGLILAGLITSLIPDEFFMHHLGGGLSAMLLMLAAGIPLYICATASTPIAAAMLLKGVSPGAALVFLLAGPATNVTSLTVLLGILGKRATVIYLLAIGIFSVAFGLILDQIYLYFDLSARAMVGKATEVFPASIQLIGAFLLLGLSIKPLYQSLRSIFEKLQNQTTASRQPFLTPDPGNKDIPTADCACKEST